MNDKLNYEIVRVIGAVSEKGSKKVSLTLVKWNNNVAKYDIRRWDENYTLPLKGLTVTESELIAIRNLLSIATNSVKSNKPIVTKEREKYTLNIYEDYGEFSFDSSLVGKVCLLSWGKNQPKFDIRRWDCDYEKYSSGIGLSDQEAINLVNLIDKEFKLEDNNCVSVDTSDIDDDLFL